MSNPMVNLLLKMASSNPNIANNPVAKEYLNVIQNGDSTKGEEIARNLCRSHGMNEQDAVANARRFFNF